MKYQFSAEIQAVEGIDGAYVEVPYNLPSYFGMGRMKVLAHFDGYEYKGSIVSSKFEDKTRYILGIKKDIRAAIGKAPGDTVEVDFECTQIAGTAYTYYELYLKKLSAKGKGAAELHEAISWLLGYSETELTGDVLSSIEFITWLEQSPNLNPLASKIKGKICGFDVASIQDETMRKMRLLDKLVDDIAKNKKKVFPD